MDQHPQAHRRADLFALSQVGGQVLRHLAGDQLHAADVGLPQAQVPADGQGPVPPDEAAHVQLPVGTGGQVGFRGVHAAPDVARAVGDGHHGPRRAAAVQAQGQRVPLPFEGVAQQRGPQQRPPQGGAGGGAEAVDLPGPLHHVPGGDDRDLDVVLRRHGAYDLSHENVPFIRIKQGGGLPPPLVCCKKLQPYRASRRGRSQKMLPPRDAARASAWAGRVSSSAASRFLERRPLAAYSSLAAYTS